jgi:hypothetical protein
MKTTKLLELATKHHSFTDYMTEIVSYDSKGKPIRKQHKLWVFTEDSLKKFVRSIEKENKRSCL